MVESLRKDTVDKAKNKLSSDVKNEVVDDEIDLLFDVDEVDENVAASPSSIGSSSAMKSNPNIVGFVDDDYTVSVEQPEFVSPFIKMDTVGPSFPTFYTGITINYSKINSVHSLKLGININNTFTLFTVGRTNWQNISRFSSKQQNDIKDVITDYNIPREYPIDLAYQEYPTLKKRVDDYNSRKVKKSLDE